MYDEELRDVGLTIAQFTLLQVLSRVGEATQSVLGQILTFDGTTLTRTLRTLERQGMDPPKTGSGPALASRRPDARRAGRGSGARFRPGIGRSRPCARVSGGGGGRG